MSTTLLFAAGCAAKCPLHAIGALALALIVGFFLGRLSCRKGKAANARKPPRPRREPRPETRIPIPAGSVEIYVGNLSYELTEAQLRETFEAFGKVDTARVVTNRFNDKSKGFGFVVMPNRAEAEAAIAALNDKEILGRKMRVNEAKNTVVKEG